MVVKRHLQVIKCGQPMSTGISRDLNVFMNHLLILSYQQSK